MWINGELTRVRSAVRAAEPDLRCTIGSYTLGGSSGLAASIHNRGNVPAYGLSLSLPTMGVVWNEQRLEPDAVARPHIPIADDASLRTRRVDDPVAHLSYSDRFNLIYELPVPLTQTPRDDQRFNLGSRNAEAVVQPPVTWRVLWRLRKQV